VPGVLIPAVVHEASTRTVLTMEYLPGLSPDEACAASVPQEQKNRWGGELLEFVIRGLLSHRFLHADPNFGNYAFLADGRLIVYDHGCMKDIPAPLADQCAQLLRALIEDDLDAIPGLLKEMGIRKQKSDEPLPRAILEPLLAEARRIVGPAPFRFSADTEIYDLLFDMKSQHFGELTDVTLPADMVFVNRTLSGLFGNLCRLGAEGRWRDLLLPYVNEAPR
jgi:predicted unusual protein kinase regulating ubiquinone biosynthesis (AarF/ABC1/UbiB family)